MKSTQRSTQNASSISTCRSPIRCCRGRRGPGRRATKDSTSSSLAARLSTERDGRHTNRILSSVATASRSLAAFQRPARFIKSTRRGRSSPRVSSICTAMRIAGCSITGPPRTTFARASRHSCVETAEVRRSTSVSFSSNCVRRAQAPTSRCSSDTAASAARSWGNSTHHRRRNSLSR